MTVLNKIIVGLRTQLVGKFMLPKKNKAGKLLQLFVIILVFSYAVIAQDWVWKPFSPDNKSWSILAPGPLKPDEEAQDSRSNKGSYAYNDFNGFFAVIYRDSPRRFLPWKPDYSAYFKQVRDDVVKANKGILLKDEQFTNGRVVGREVQVKFASGTMTGMEGQSITKYRIQRFRMFFKGKRFFVILAVLPEKEIDKPFIDNYFNSFAAVSPPEAVADQYITDEDMTLTVQPGNGVLANDKDEEGDKLSVAALKPSTPPAHGNLTLNTDGSFTYQPEPNFNGRDSFTYKANDSLVDSDAATVTIIVNPVNDAPVLNDVPTSLTVDELAVLKFTASATDIDNPASSLRFSLTSEPKGASIDPKTGVFSWVPDETQGPGNFTFKTNVTDGTSTSSATINIVTNEVNVSPQISNVPASASINELEQYSFTARATDTDIPAQTITYSLIGAPDGASINPNTGVFNWTPNERQGDGSSLRFVVRASDGSANTDAAINLTVNEINSAPTLAAISDQTIDELKTLSLNVIGSDADLPANTLVYSLEQNAPAGMTINSSTGAISWTPTEAQGQGDYSVSVRVTDNGTPALSGTKTFKVHINEVNTAPKLDLIGNKTSAEESAVNLKISATDADLPANALTYTLLNSPTGAIIDSSTGIISWTPTEAQGPGSFNFTVRVTDNGNPSLSDEQTFTLSVTEVNKAPVASDAAISTDEDKSISIILKAVDADLPANKLIYSIITPPVNGKLSGTGPTLTYTPNPDFNGNDKFIFKVNDGVIDSNSAAVNISIKPVNDIPIANNDAAVTDKDVSVLINVTANDKDIDGDNISLINTSNVINGKAEIVNGAIRFTPDLHFQGQGKFNYTISDGKGGTASGSVTVTVNSVKPKT